MAADRLLPTQAGRQSCLAAAAADGGAGDAAGDFPSVS